MNVDGHPSLRQRAFGLGSVYGKSLRDARRGFLTAGIGIGLLVFLTASQVAAEFGTPAARAAMAALPSQLPVIFRGLLGQPIDIARLAGFVSWRVLNFSTIILGVWSIIGLAGTLSREAERGSLDLTLAAPRSRRGVAAQKACAHLTSIAIATVMIGVFTWAATNVFATLPGDQASLPAVLAHMLWLALMVLFPATIAWCLAPLFGRGTAAGCAALVMIASFVVHGYRDALPAFQSLDALSYFGWTAGHRPLAGVTDWPAMGALASIDLLLIALGVVVFQRRDIGITIDIAVPLPRLHLGLRGPLGRSFGERLPAAAWTGLALGAFGLVFALSADSFVAALRTIPQVQTIINRVFPGVDLFSTGGVLQLVFFEVGTLWVIALAGVVAGGWATDEEDKRLELVLAAPMSRFEWALRSGTGALLAIAAFAVIAGLFLAVGTLIAKGDDPTGPFVGMLVLGAYAALLVGTGVAAGGLLKPGLAAGTAAGLGLSFYLFEVFGSALGLPQQILDLAPTKHIGQPMAGVYDPIGTALVVGIAVGGVVLGAIGMSRRDVGR